MPLSTLNVNYDGNLDITSDRMAILVIVSFESAIKLEYRGQLGEDSANHLDPDVGEVLGQIRTGLHPYGGCTPHPPLATQSDIPRLIRQGQRRTRAAVLRSECSKPKRTYLRTQKYIFREDS